jgi:protoheme IX farnesyltransferase
MVPCKPCFAGTLGIALVAGAAAAMNCLIEQEDRRHHGAHAGPPAAARRGEFAGDAALSAAIGGIGLSLLNAFVNPLTMWLTLATFVGYAIIYTVILKPRRRRTSSSAAPPAPCRRCWAGRP